MKLKKYILFPLLMLAAMAQAQFVNVEWNLHSGDTLLPVCSSVIDLPQESYGNYTYSAHVEYPEYRKMEPSEVARYSLETRYAHLEEQPLIECYVAVQVKQPQLNVVVLPVVKRNGEYYRLNSYKLVVDKKRSSAQKAASRTVAERYAPSSVLATGKWVRIAVEENGVHKITHSELARMGFKTPSKVRLYGYGGHILPETGLENLTDDLAEVPLWREEGFVLFYANGTIKWEHKAGRFRHEQNVYSQYGCYFLTESDEPAAEFPAETLSASSDKRITSFPDYALHEKEEYAVCSYGRVLVENYNYSQGRTVSYRFPLEGVAAETGVADISFATNGIEMSRVEISVAGNSAGMLSVPSCTSGEFGKIVESSFSINKGLGDNPVVKLTHSVSNSSVTGHLDYIRLNFTRSLALRGTQTLFRGNLPGESASFEISGCNANTHVWSVAGGKIKELKGELQGGVYTVVAPAGYDDELVVLNTKGNFPSVKVLGNVPNQNLHAIEQADMVIIVPSNGSFLAAAERLAEAHRQKDNLSVVVVTASQVYNEFSSGTPDVTAYRRFMKMLYDRAGTAAEAPKYLLLLGDGWYDNRLVTFPGRKQDDYLLCFESQNSVDAIQSYVLEDYMGFLDDGEGGNFMRDKIDLGIGRIPAQTALEAGAVVDKIISYMNNENAGVWQNHVLLLGDDGDVSMPNQHMEDADSIASVLEKNYPSYLIDRIYWDNYPVEVSSTGNRYPLVTRAIYDHLNEGALIVNYSGHGSANLLSHEMTWKASDMAALDSPRLPFWVTASCDIGPFDIGDNSVAEAAILNAKGAAVGLLTTTRTVLQSYNSIINKEFMRQVLSSTNSGEPVAVGDALRRAKCNLIASSSDLRVNKLQYVLLGDPALRLKTPDYRLVVEKFNGKSADDTARVEAGGLVTVEGFVADRAGNEVKDFTGMLYTTLYDSAEEIVTRDNIGIGAYSYTAHEKVLFSGSDSVVSGRFSVKIPVPMDISYSNDLGMLNIFAVDSACMHSAQGRYDNFIVGGTAQSVTNDGKGPEIKLYLNTPSFVSGDEVNATPCLVAELHDVNGINTVGSGVGHDIVAIVDNDPKYTYNLNSSFVPVVGDYTAGKVVMPLDSLSAGEHTLLLRAWDLYNNSSVAQVSFYVEPTLAPDFISFAVNPSPVVCGSPATFVVSHNRPQSEMEVTVDIFNLQGQLLWSKSENVVCDGSVYAMVWNGTLQGGQPLSTGVYLARAYIASGGSLSSSRTVKFVVINNK